MANSRDSERAAPDDIFDIVGAAFAGVGTESDLLRRIVGDAPVGIALLDANLRWQYANAEFTRTTGLRAADIIGLPIARTPLAQHADALASVLADARPCATTLSGTDPGVDVRCRRLELRGQAAGVIVVVADGSAAPHRQPRDLLRSHDRLTVLDAAAQRIGTTLDVDTTCAELVEFAAPAMADLAIVELSHPRGANGTTVFPDPSCLRRVAVACAPRVRPGLMSLADPGESVSYGTESPIGRSLRTGAPVVADLLADTEPGGSDPRFDVTMTAFRAAGLATMLVVPLAAHGRVSGVLILARAAESSPGFPDDDIELVGDVAARAAVSIANADHLARAQGTAVELQRALLTEPGKPHANLELAFRYLPTGSTSVVGGDWYEIVRLSFGRTLLVMGDVMGHGVEAAVDMSTYRSALRYVAAMDLPPHRILRRLDALMDEEAAARPATCLLALADPNRDRWTFSSAGHLPPALIAADGSVELVEVPTGPPLGSGFGGYEQLTRGLRRDEILLLYTDGLVERRDQDIDDSLARLASLRPPAAGALDNLLDAVLGALAPHAVEDDIALLAARVPRR